MPTAVEALNRQKGVLQDPSISNNHLDIDLDTFLLDVVGRHGYDIDVAGSIVGGNIERTMDGASNVTVTVNDHSRKILRSGLLGDGTEEHYPAIDVNFDGLWMRLADINKNSDNIDLVFEDRIIAYLRTHRKPLKVNRRQMTRAQFVHSMVREVKATRINFFSPAEGIRQPIESIDTSTKTRREKKKPGFHKPSKLKVKGNKANQRQVDVGATVLAIGDDMGASYKLLVASIMTMTTESGLNPNIGQDYMKSGHIGAFQQDSAPGSIWRQLGGATGNLKRDAKAFFKMGIQKDKEFPKASAASLASFIQYPGTRPGIESSYKNDVGQWTSDAKEWVKQFNGEGGGSTTITETRRKQYYYRRGYPDGPHGENSWDCAERLAEEVNWHRFVVGNTFFYVRDHDLMKQQASDTLSEKDPAVEYIDFDMDSNKSVEEATVTCRAVRWMAHPGEVVVVEDCGPANGRWLVQSINKPIFDQNATITLRKPHGSKKEPAPDVITKSWTKGEGGGKVGTVGNVEIMPGADRAGVPTKQHVLRFVELMAGALGKKIYISTGSNHSRLSASGNISDHWTGDGADLGSAANHFRIATPGGPPTGGDEVARAAALVLGIHLKDVTGNWYDHPWTYRGVNYRVQIGWRVSGHYDHVHVGVKKIGGTVPLGPEFDGQNIPRH